MLRIGILGPPGCGKTSLFKALAPSEAVQAGAGGKREIHVGQAKVPDPRLDELFRIFQRTKQVNAVVEYVDLAGFSREEVARSGYDAQFLGEIRTCDALLHLLRCFEQPGLPDPNPARDFKSDQEEFILSDQMILEGRLERLRKEDGKRVDPELPREIKLMERCLDVLQEGKPLRTLEFSGDEFQRLKSYQLLSAKPELAVLNLAEEDIARAEALIEKYRPGIESPRVHLSAACASIEMEIAELDAGSAREFMEDLGLKESALTRLVQASYELLGLISFFTVGTDECRAWTIRRGTRAREAAGIIHSDMERGFIRAETVHFDDFSPRGGYAECRKDGVLRLEGKDYVVQDGDIIEFRFAI